MADLANDFIIIDPDDQLAIVKKILKDEIKENNFYTDKPKALVNFINKSKDEGKRALDLLVTNENRFQQLIYVKYEKYLRQENKLDFAELILLTKGSHFPLLPPTKHRLIFVSCRTPRERTGFTAALCEEISLYTRGRISGYIDLADGLVETDDGQRRREEHGSQLLYGRG